MTYFVSSLTEMNIFLLLNLIRLELRSASESIQPVLIIWVSLNSNSAHETFGVRSPSSDGLLSESEPGLTLP